MSNSDNHIKRKLQRNTQLPRIYLKIQLIFSLHWSSLNLGPAKISVLTFFSKHWTLPTTHPKKPPCGKRLIRMGWRMLGYWRKSTSSECQSAENREGKLEHWQQGSSCLSASFVSSLIIYVYLWGPLIVLIFWKEDHRSKVPFTSDHIRGVYCRRGVWMLMLTR